MGAMLGARRSRAPRLARRIRSPRRCALAAALGAACLGGAVAAASAAPVLEMASASYRVTGGSFASAASAALVSTSAPKTELGTAGGSFAESLAGPPMTAPSGITAEPGFWPIAVPEADFRSQLLAGLCLLFLLARREARRPRQAKGVHP